MPFATERSPLESRDKTGWRQKPCLNCGHRVQLHSRLHSHQGCRNKHRAVNILVHRGQYEPLIPMPKLGITKPVVKWCWRQQNWPQTDRMLEDVLGML